jgi:tetratricopeptide (TPR) repeat protein
MRLASCLLALGLVATASAEPQTLQDDPHAACAAPAGWVPRAMLSRPVPLREGTGNAREDVTAASAEARAFYIQGLNYLHGYVWIEAARSFHQALRLDPELAMAHVGLSRVYSGLEAPDDAREALGQALARAAKVTPRERRRIAVRAAQLDAMADLPTSRAIWPTRKRSTTRSRSTSTTSSCGCSAATRGAHRRRTRPARRRGLHRLLRPALKLQPDNGAAHHYLTHSYETIGQIPAALEHGEVYARIAPAIPIRITCGDTICAGWAHRRRHRRLPPHRRDGERVLRGGGDHARAGLAPRPQPRPASPPPTSTRGRCAWPSSAREMAALPPVRTTSSSTRRRSRPFLLDRGRAAEAWPPRARSPRPVGGGAASGRAAGGTRAAGPGRAARRVRPGPRPAERGSVPTLGAA